MPDVFALDHVSVVAEGRRGRSTILDDVSFSIGPGETFGLVGESGCGKSTVALAAMRYLPAGLRINAGRVMIEGRDIATLSGRELRGLRGNRLAMVYQDPMSSLNPVKTIGAQLIEVPMLHGETDRARAASRAIAMLDEVRLADAGSMMSRYPHQLSGGQQQRVVIAMALMAEPRLLILDEPTTGLDVTIEAAILELVRDLKVKFGAAILFISHNLGTVARLCDRIGVLYAGRLVETGDVRDVFKEPAHPYTRGLLAALPERRGGHGARLRPIEGTLSAADRDRPGCAFAPRCEFVEPAICATSPIPMAPASGSPDHVARCARIAEVARRSRVTPEASPRNAGAAADGRTLLAVEGLSKIYEIGGRFSSKGARRVRALSDVSLEARAGRTLAIVGESGSGKSTLAKIVAGLFEASSGRAELAGADIADKAVDKRPRELRRLVQMVFQNPDSTLNPSHSVEYALMRPLRKLRGLSAGEARAEAARLMERVRLPAEMLKRLPHQLSGGQRQRVAIARALAGGPDLIIADEPVSALDVSVQAAIVNLLGELLEQGDLGLVVISHDLALVRHMADQVAVMYLGRAVEYGPADQVLAPPFHPYTEALLAAAPEPDPDAGPPGVVLTGAMPSPSAEIRGCVFASRCPRNLGPICDDAPPPLVEFGAHRIECHLIARERAAADRTRARA